MRQEIPHSFCLTVPLSDFVPVEKKIKDFYVFFDRFYEPGIMFTNIFRKRLKQYKSNLFKFILFRFTIHNHYVILIIFLQLISF